MEPIRDDYISSINEEMFYRERLPMMCSRELFDRIHRLFPDECESVTMLRRLMGEAYRRLNEADALRKENEKLKAQNILIRGDSAELLAEADAYSFNLSNMNASIAELRKENEELRKLLGECPKRNNRLGRYSDAKPVQIDVCKLICMTKESEASHE